jgi:hypothetical protein
VSALPSPACPDCAVAARLAREALGAAVYECACGRTHRARIARVYRVDPDAPTPARGALERAAHHAVTGDDPELARVRTLLAALRPDYPDAWEPMPKAPPQTVAVRAGGGRAPWDVDLPRGLGSSVGAQLAAAEALSPRAASAVMERIRALPPDAAAVLRWLRTHASLSAGLRGLWHDVGMAFASAAQEAAWEDLTVRRGFAPAHGRRLVLRAAEAWEDEG